MCFPYHLLLLNKHLNLVAMDYSRHFDFLGQSMICSFEVVMCNSSITLMIKLAAKYKNYQTNYINHLDCHLIVYSQKYATFTCKILPITSFLMIVKHTSKYQQKGFKVAHYELNKHCSPNYVRIMSCCIDLWLYLIFITKNIIILKGEVQVQTSY